MQQVEEDNEVGFAYFFWVLSLSCMSVSDKRYIFIGYDEKTEGYKLLDPISKMVIVSRDVRVNEASEWDWNNSTEVNIEVGESSVAAPTSAPTDS